MGKNWFSDLKLFFVLHNLSDNLIFFNALNNVPLVPSEEFSLKSLLKKHESLFLADLGLLKDVKVPLSLKGSAN